MVAVMSDIDVLETQVRALEKENRALKQNLWDQFFMAACKATLHHGKVTGVTCAAEIADEMLRVRQERHK